MEKRTWIKNVLSLFHDGSTRWTKKSFCTHRLGSILRMAEASAKRRIYGILSLARVLKDCVLSTAWPKSTICLPIELLGSSLPFSIKPFGRCSEILVDQFLSVRPSYLLPHVHVKTWTTFAGVLNRSNVHT